RDRVLSANAYIGSTPIVEALSRSANIVITGRSTDTALTMAPLRFEFGWADNDWDKLASGIIAGHTIECGAQCSGGNCLYDWQSIPDLANVGYPIVEGHADGSFVIYKHPNTGGRISVPSVTEQLVYEMGDPNSYITPDVIADFTTIHLEAAGENRVRLFGIKGRPPTDKLKVSIAYRAGFKAVGTLVYSWPDAYPKAQLADRVLRERLDNLGLKFDHIMTEFVGVSATHGPLAGEPHDPPEVQLRFGVRGENKADIERFTREIVPLVLNGPPSVTGFAGGRPKVEEIVAYWPALVDKTVVQTNVEVLT
ncbi:MAG TPA: acyclic terpene utilization AtuA family protein, partial [Gemmatimonadaceae bacterium]|nr:acyclic terpene utilization AtuA family protein [Gemmatimonadaceae bacterium]